MSDYVDALIEQSSLNSAFNAEQAQLNRDWQEYMSGTSHQREVADLILAGLNPVLSANSGSSFSSVGNATADTSSAAGLAALAQTVLNNRASIEMAKISAAAQTAAAATSAGGVIRAAEINQQTANSTAPVTVSGSVLGSGGSVTVPSSKVDALVEYLQNVPTSSSDMRSGAFRSPAYN